MAQVIYMHGVMNSDNVLSLSSVLLLGIIVVVTTLAIGGQMTKAGLVNDNSITEFAGQSRNIQRTAIAVVVITPAPTTTLNPTPISTTQRNLPAAAEVTSSTSNATSPLDCNGAFEKIPLIFRQATLEKIQDCVTFTGIVTFVHYYSPDGDAIVNVYPDPPFLHLMSPANTRAPFVDPGVYGSYPKPGIHAEIPCQAPTKETKPFQGDYCRGDNKALWPHIPTRPKVGDHVKVTGTLATDINELGGITEIHPVTYIQIISASPKSSGSGANNITARVSLLPMPSMSSTDKSDRR
jgi:hypothetical protein